MSLETAGRILRFATLVMTALLIVSCVAYDYAPSRDSSLEGDAWTLSSTAQPYFLRDDASQSGFGKTAIYSYAHNAQGQRFALVPGENRGVFRTSRGSVIALSLGVRIPMRGRPSSFIYIGDFTDWDSPEGWTYETRDRGSFTINRQSGGPLSVSITGGPSGTRIQILTDGETMRVTLDDLYRWRKLKAQDSSTKQVHLGPETYAIMGIAVEDERAQQQEYSFGSGNAYFKISELFGGSDRLEPNYATLIVARGQRVADRIPIGDSGYESVWDPKSGIYLIYGIGTNQPAATSPQQSGEVVFGSPFSYIHPTGLFAIEFPSNWEIVDLSKDPDEAHVQAHDPSNRAWLAIEVDDLGESSSQVDLKDWLIDFVRREWARIVWTLSSDDEVTRQADGSLRVAFKGYYSNPDKEGYGVSNQIQGYAFIKRQKGLLGIIGMYMLKTEFDSKRGLVFNLIDSFRLGALTTFRAEPSLNSRLTPRFIDKKDIPIAK